jgi:hypothetical protein
MNFTNYNPLQARYIQTGLATSILISAFQGADKDIQVPLLGSYKAPLGGFLQGVIGTMLTDNLVYPYVHDMITKYEPDQITDYNKTVLARAATYGTTSAALLSTSGIPNGEAFVIGVLADRIVLPIR